MLPLPPEVKAPKIPSRIPRELDSDRERRRRITEIAYSRAVRRGFDGDSDQAFEDWLAAARIVDQPRAGLLR